MQTRLAEPFASTPAGREAEAILRRCVHCGFCNATCPTYQVVGDELDGPRGRIYLIKQLLEGRPATRKTQLHLDRCLTCRACETTCPSGVEYGRLVEIGRAALYPRARRPWAQSITRWLLREGLSRPRWFAAALGAARWLRPLMPRALRNKVPLAVPPGTWPNRRHARVMLSLAGCVQGTLAPATNAATARVLDRLGITLLETRGCCGAVRHHLDDETGARETARRNIDAWWPLIEAGAEAIVMTASGCGLEVRDYGHLLAGDPEYASRAARVAALARDVSEVVAGEAAPLARWIVPGAHAQIVFHSPCTLQHGQKIRGVVEGLLAQAGFALAPVADAHLCCGSAGTYSILQPALATTLRDNKLAALCAQAPSAIATANIGCQAHLQTGTSLPVAHWITLFEARLASAALGANPD